jgi:hypothetical protein
MRILHVKRTNKTVVPEHQELTLREDLSDANIYLVSCLCMIPITLLLSSRCICPIADQVRSTWFEFGRQQTRQLMYLLDAYVIQPLKRLLVQSIIAPGPPTYILRSFRVHGTIFAAAHT